MGQRMKAVADHGAKRVVVEFVLRVGPHPEEGQPHAQRLDGVEDADHLHLHRRRVAELAPEDGDKVRCAAALIIAIGKLHVPFRRLIAAQKPDLVDQPSERAHRIGAARIAEEEDPVTGAIAPGQPAIGAPDLAVDAAPHGHVGGVAPHMPLNARLIVKRQMRGGGLFPQEPVDAADIRLLPRFEGGCGSVQQDDMGGGRAAARGAVRLDLAADAQELKQLFGQPRHPSLPSLSLVQLYAGPAVPANTGKPDPASRPRVVAAPRTMAPPL